MAKWIPEISTTQPIISISFRRVETARSSSSVATEKNYKCSSNTQTHIASNLHRRRSVSFVFFISMCASGALINIAPKQTRTPECAQIAISLKQPNHHGGCFDSQQSTSSTEDAKKSSWWSPIATRARAIITQIQVFRKRCNQRVVLQGCEAARRRRTSDIMQSCDRL